MNASACTRASHEAIKSDRSLWEALKIHGIQAFPEGDLEMRNCGACGSTLAKQRERQHTKDADCIVDASGCCATCGVSQTGDPCEECGGVGYHAEGCHQV